MKTLVLILILNITALASCYKVGNFKGVSAYKYKNYEIVKDGITGRVFNINTDKDKASVQPSNIECIALNRLSLVCLSDSGNGATMETWLINGNKVQYTKSVTGNNNFDSVKLFIGDVLGSCN